MPARLHIVAPALLAALVAAGMLGGCAATAEGARDDTKVTTLLPSVRVDPPADGRNTIWIEFQDQTGQAVDLYDEVRDAVENRGYRVVGNFQEADYALWATLRIFDRAGEEFDQKLAALGGVAGGTATGLAVASGTRSAPAGIATGAAAGGLVGAGIAWLTTQNTWAMVVDVQLARRIEGGVTTQQSTELDREAVTDVRQDTSFGGEGGSAVAAAGTTQAVTEVRSRLEIEQRIVAETSGSRMDRDVAEEAMLPRVRNVLGQLLPRAG